MNDLILTLDIGTTGAKAALIDSDGAVLRSSTRTYQTTLAAGNHVEQSPDDWWQAAINAIRELETPNECLAAVSVSGQMQNTILTRSAECIRSAILYSDTRAVEEAARVNEVIGQSRLRQITGNDQDASSLLAKLLWLQANESLSGADAILTGAHDYIVLKLCGVACTDPTTAATTGFRRGSGLASCCTRSAWGMCHWQH
jgi:xylulokinase